MSDEPSDLCCAIGAVMGQVLERVPLTPTEDFFDCGGDSLRAVEVLRRLLGEGGTVDQGGLPVRSREDLEAVLLEAIFDHSSPAALEEVLRCSLS